MSAAMRTCPITGLKVDGTADALIKSHAVAATVSLLVGGVAALLVLLTRWQAVHLLDAVWFYRMLTVHGMNMLIFFIIFIEMAVLYFASAVLLSCRVPAPKVGWAAFALMVVGREPEKPGYPGRHVPAAGSADRQGKIHSTEHRPD